MSTPTTAAPLVRLGRRPAVGEYLRSLWERREFALAIPSAELRAKNQNTVLGGLWHLLNPLLLVGIYYLIFGVILNVSRGQENFIGFLTIGVFIFHFTSKSVTSAAKSIVNNESLIRAISFPRAILPLSVVLSEFAAFGYALATMLAVVLVTGEQPYWTWLLVLPVIGLQLLFNTGVALFFARLTDHFRDVTQVLPYLMRLWLYLSGVLYDPAQRLSDGPYEGLLVLLQLNPAYAYIRLAREAILENSWGQLHWWLAALAWSVVILVAGFLFFRHREHEYGHG